MKKTGKSNLDLEKMIDWILLIQQNIETYNGAILNEKETEVSSDLSIFYRRATDSYFIMILRNLLDKDTQTSSITTFSEQFIEDEFNSLLSEYTKRNYSDHENARLQKFSEIIKEIREKRDSIYKDYNQDYKKWMNNVIGHFNTVTSHRIIESNSGKTQYARPPITKIIIEISCLLNLFQTLIDCLSDASKFSNYQFRSIDKNEGENSMFPSISPKQSFPALEVFDEWNKEKKLLITKEQESFYVNEREIWYIKLGVNIGSESNGKKDFRRPVLVIKKVGSMFFVVPLTTKGKESKFYHTIDAATYISAHHIPEVSRVQLSQVRVVEKKVYPPTLRSKYRGFPGDKKRSFKTYYYSFYKKITPLAWGIPKDICKSSISDNS